MKNGDGGKVVGIWEKVTLNKAVGPANFSAFSNLGTIKLLSRSAAGIRQGIDAKVKLIESDCFGDFVRCG